MIHSSTFKTLERPAGLVSALISLGVKCARDFPLILAPALLLALGFGRMLCLGLSMADAEDRKGGTRFEMASGVPSLAWQSRSTQPSEAVDPGMDALIARGMLAGMVMIETAILRDPDEMRQLPAPLTFMSNDIVPFQLRTADFTTDAAICSGMGVGVAGYYRFDFRDGGLSFGKVYCFLDFVTQTYRPISLRDQRLLLQRSAQRTAPDVQYVGL